MQVFVPYPAPIDVARCLDKKRLTSQIRECHLIISTIKGESDGWMNHPIVAMYEDNLEWLEAYTQCLESYSKGNFMAEYYSTLAEAISPDWLTDEFCDQHKRRLYTKDPIKYAAFSKYGESEENWYVIRGKIVKYADGKKL